MREDGEFQKEIYDKGTRRDWVIFDLFHYTKFADPQCTDFTSGLSREEFQQFRSALDGFSRLELLEERTWQRKELKYRDSIYPMCASCLVFRKPDYN
jgi:hypothetical protein